MMQGVFLYNLKMPNLYMTAILKFLIKNSLLLLLSLFVVFLFVWLYYCMFVCVFSVLLAWSPFTNSQAI